MGLVMAGKRSGPVGFAQPEPCKIIRAGQGRAGPSLAWPVWHSASEQIDAEDMASGPVPGLKAKLWGYVEHRPHHVVLFCAGLSLALIAILCWRAATLLNERHLAQVGHELDHTRIAFEAFMEQELRRVQTLRQVAEESLQSPHDSDASAPDAQLQAAYAARNQPTWQLPLSAGGPTAFGFPAELALPWPLVGVVVALLLWVSLVVISRLFARFIERGEALRALAEHDALTGLANRRAFEHRFRLERDRRQRNPEPLSLVPVDVDHFKRINDTWGHATAIARWSRWPTPAGTACVPSICPRASAVRNLPSCCPLPALKRPAACRTPSRSGSRAGGACRRRQGVARRRPPAYLVHRFVWGGRRWMRTASMS